ncbi:hypothetical protein MKW98_021779 [Papaver atlanticum]|uniref:F-box domain-containing protein n=1 Tax=Papaver atlanticum TaxID=357466 RepID=A0AAD4X6F4_9MAGN|nr:hypothetical protein MKW98_021779 [Papaver atlanticum]
MENLPNDLLSKILFLVPCDSVLNCKLVCKTWKTLISHRQVISILFSLGTESEMDCMNELYYGYYEEIKGTTKEEFNYRTSLKKINHPPMNRRDHVDSIVGCCNGLVCFIVPHDHVDDPVYICNPITGEYVNLPELNAEVGLIVGGFGYLRSANVYKVIRIHYPSRVYFSDVQLSAGSVQIYTFGDCGGGGGYRRSIGETSYSLTFQGTLVNGSLYWLDNKDWKIVSFNLSDEEFSLLPTVPPCLLQEDPGKNTMYRMKVLQGNLCLVHLQLGEHVNIWSYKDNLAKQNERDNPSLGWSLEFSIPYSCKAYHEPFAVTKHNEVLLWYGYTRLCCYDSSTKTLSKIVDEDGDLTNSFCAIPHISSMVSLKALGVNSKKHRYYSCQNETTDDKQPQLVVPKLIGSANDDQVAGVTTTI